jgi:CxxC-x17-CxxC domain-containing protein
MGKFNRGGDRGGFGGGKKFGGRDRSYDRDAPRQMHKATCAECGDACEVPFKPSGDRPVLCSNCFKNSGRGEERSERRDDRREERSFDRPRRDFGEKEMFDAVCAECGQHCQVPFKPRGDKDVFCSDCFGKDKGESRPFTHSVAPKSANYDKQFELLNSKLNTLIGLMTSKVEGAKSETTAKPAAAKPVEAKKEVAKEVKKVEEKKPEMKKVEKKSTSAKATVDKADKKVAPKKKSTSAKATVDKASKKK